MIGLYNFIYGMVKIWNLIKTKPILSYETKKLYTNILYETSYELKLTKLNLNQAIILPLSVNNICNEEN